MGAKMSPGFLTEDDVAAPTAVPVEAAKPVEVDAEASAAALAAAHKAAETKETKVGTVEATSELQRDLVSADVEAGLGVEAPPTEEDAQKSPYQAGMEALVFEFKIEDTGDPAENFVKALEALAKKLEPELKIPVPVMVAMAGMESSYSDETGPVNPEAFLRNFAIVIAKPEYAEALKHKDDPRAFLTALVEAGYAGLMDTPEKVKAYVDAAEASIKPYGLDFGNLTVPEAPKSWWASIIAGLGSTKDGVFAFLKTIKDTVFGWFGWGKKKTEDAAQAVGEVAGAAVAKAKEKIYELLDMIDPDAPLFTFPKGVTPQVTSDRGMRTLDGVTRPHEGVDIGGLPEGTPIIATKGLVGATIDHKGFDADGAGNLVDIRLKNGDMGKWFHLQVASTLEEPIQEGSVIGYVGHTGHSKGDHLHFELWKNGENTNPDSQLSQNFRGHGGPEGQIA